MTQKKLNNLKRLDSIYKKGIYVSLRLLEYNFQDFFIFSNRLTLGLNQFAFIRKSMRTALNEVQDI